MPKKTKTLINTQITLKSIAISEVNNEERGNKMTSLRSRKATTTIMDTPKKSKGKVMGRLVKKNREEKTTTIPRSLKQRTRNKSKQRMRNGKAPVIRIPAVAVEQKRVKTCSNPQNKQPRKQKSPRQRVFMVEPISSMLSSLNRRRKERFVKKQYCKVK